jgi:hypothetical protein
MFVVIAYLSSGTRVHGPYPTVARASGVGFSTYGPIVFGRPRWGVYTMEWK